MRWREMLSTWDSTTNSEIKNTADGPERIQLADGIGHYGAVVEGDLVEALILTRPVDQNRWCARAVHQVQRPARIQRRHQQQASDPVAQQLAHPA